MTKLEEIESKYKRNEDGSVTRSASEITNVDKNRGIINLKSVETLVWSEEINDIHWLINRVKKLEEALKSIEPITGYRNGKDTVKIDRDLVDNALKEDS